MAKKYIDAELLRKAVEKQIDYAKGDYPKGSMEEARASAITAVYRNILASIDSLQQEQPAVITTHFIQTKPCEGQEMSVSSEEEQPCDTCTNDKGCVTCKNGELWEGQRTWIEQSSEDLEEAVSEQICIAADKHIKRVVDAAGHPGWDWTTQDIADAFKAGAEWQKEQIFKGDRLTELDKSYKQAKRELEWFEEGKRQGREQMLKDAMECELVCFKDHLLAVLPMKEFRWTAGDKVKVIIIPDKEDKK